MNEKVWVIEDISEGQADRNESSQQNGHEPVQKSTHRVNPLLAYSLSVIIWGCGQLYNKKRRSGIFFLLGMISFFLFTGAFFMQRDTVRSFFKLLGVDGSGTLIIFGLIYLTGLLTWSYNSWEAYFSGLKICEVKPAKSGKAWLPALCSLVIPGWGQLLNGQVKKSLVFHFFALIALTIFPVVFIIFSTWPTLEPSRTRLFIEWIFTISVLLSPFIPVVWLLNFFDALKVSRDHVMKSPLSARIKSRGNRLRYHIQLYGLKNALLPLFKRMTLIVLLLVFCFITYQYVPWEFYRQELLNMVSIMSEKDMTILPGIIEKVFTPFQLP